MVVEVVVAAELKLMSRWWQLLVPTWAAAAVVEAGGERPQRPAQPYLGILVAAAEEEEAAAVGWYPSQRASPAEEGEEGAAA